VRNHRADKRIRRDVAPRALGKLAGSLHEKTINRRDFHRSPMYSTFSKAMTTQAGQIMY
jgi:hypothetical protein